MSTSTWPKKGDLLYTEDEVNKLKAENERLQAMTEKAWKQADDVNNAALKSALRNRELEAEIERLTSAVCANPIIKDAERWRETMLEWGDGVVNGFGDFWDRISAQMTREEQQAAIDAARERE